MNMNTLEAFDYQQRYLSAAQFNSIHGEKDAARQNAREALYYGKYILSKADGDEPYITGTYQNMAVAKYVIYKNSGLDDLNLVRDALAFVKKALEAKPANQIALIHGALFYALLGDFRNVAKFVSKLTDEGFLDHLQYVTDQLMNNTVSAVIPRNKIKDLPEAIETLFDVLEKRMMAISLEESAKELIVSGLLINKAQLYYAKVGDYVKAYSIMEQALKNRPEDATLYSAYRIMNLICSTQQLNKKEEALKYGELAFRYLETDADERTKADALSGYGLALCRMGDEAGLDKCREAAEVWPSDVTYYNYARALYEMKMYEEALPWAWKAELLYADDEMNLMLLADVYRGLKDSDKAVEYYIKAYHKLQNTDDLLAYRHTDPAGNVEISYTAPEYLTFFLRETLKGIIRVYMGKNQQKANAWLCVAEELYPEDESFELMKDALEAIAVSREEVEELKRELTAAKTEAEKQRKMSTSMIKRLIRIQDESVSLDLENEEDWEVFSGKIDGIIQNLEEDAKKNKALLQKIRKRLGSEYSFLSDKALQFLITAEVLYEIHKGTEIDFACIGLEYIKVCELEIVDHLVSILPPDIHMLGSLIGFIRKNKVMPYRNHLRIINAINELRKNSAHTGMLTQKDVELIKKIYFADGFLNVLKDDIWLG